MAYFFWTRSVLKDTKGVNAMGCIVRVHHPNITEEERQARIEKIKEALVEFYKECHKKECSKK